MMETINSASTDVKIEPTTAVPNDIKKTEEPNVKPQVIVKESKEKDKLTKEKKHGKEEKSSKKKDDRTVEQILKSLGHYETAEEKLNVLCKKYLEVLDDNRKNAVALKQIDKRITIMQRQNEQVTAEKNKALLAKSRLENLCRELQKQNKSVKEESLLKVKEEEEKRKEVSAKFQTTLTDITALMAEANEKNDKLYEDNIEMEAKFRALLEETILREQRFENMKQMMEHELLLAKGTLAKITIEMSEEKETLLKDKTTLLHKLSQYQDRIQELQTTEANLRSQLAIYTDKYNEFQNALHKSNEVFGGFNQEMEKMSKKSLKLEKEALQWKARWEKGQAALLEMAADKQVRDAEFATLNKKFLKLQELCKTFQHERAMLMARLKEKETGVPCPSLPLTISATKLNVPGPPPAKSNGAVVKSTEPEPQKTCRTSKPSGDCRNSIKKNLKDAVVELEKVVNHESNKDQAPKSNVESQKGSVQKDSPKCPVQNFLDVQSNDLIKNKTDASNTNLEEKNLSNNNNDTGIDQVAQDVNAIKSLKELNLNEPSEVQKVEAPTSEEKSTLQSQNVNLCDGGSPIPNGDEKCSVPGDDNIKVKVGVLTET